MDPRRIRLRRRGVGAPVNRTDQRVGPRLFRTGDPGEAIVCILLTAAIAAYPFRGHLAALIEGAAT